jgi:hypothetical protein
MDDSLVASLMRQKVVAQTCVHALGIGTLNSRKSHSRIEQCSFMRRDPANMSGGSVLMGPGLKLELSNRLETYSTGYID